MSGTGWLDARGYTRIYAPEHPLADAGGIVPRHRMLLFEALGQPTTSACHWCGYELPWKTDRIPAFKHVINVDHLNDVKGDDRLENLAPACFWCNRNRKSAPPIAPGLWLWAQRSMRSIAPIDRPEFAELLAFVEGADYIEISA